MLLALGAWLARLLPALASPHPTGTDGYFYVVQAERLLAEGRLHVPDASWVFPFLAGVCAPFRDPILGVKVGAALLAAACVPAFFALGRAVAGRPGSWLGAAWAAGSPTIAQLATEFPKNLGVAAPFLALVGALSAGWGRAATWRRAPWRPLSLALLGLGCAGAHRTGAALLLLAGLGWVLGRALRGGDGLRWGWGILLLLAGAALFAAASAALPALLHPADLERLQGHFRLEPHWPAPWGWLALRHRGPLQVVELSACWLPLAAALPVALARPALRPSVGALALPLLVLLFPGWRYDELDLGYRLSLLAPLLAAPLGLALVAPVLTRARLPRALVLAVLTAPLCGATGVDLGEMPPYARFAALIARLPRPLPSLLICEPGMSFFYDHLTGAEAMAWAPERELDRREVGRVVWGVRTGEWLAWLPVELDQPRPLPLGDGYHYVREDAWESFLAATRELDDDDLVARLADLRNPRVVRPAALTRNR